MTDEPADLHHSLTEHIRKERAAAARAMDSLGGQRSACAMGRHGQSFPAYKYHEGRAAALGDLGRLLARSADINDALHTVLGRWREEVARRTGGGPDWEAYANGGLEAAQSVAGWLND